MCLQGTALAAKLNLEEGIKDGRVILLENEEQMKEDLSKLVDDYKVSIRRSD
jgi:hypothetical protein